MTYKAFDVVKVPFPFTDKNQAKMRPALVISSDKNFGNEIEHSVLVMITSAKNSAWPLDVNLSDLNAAGLSSASVIRMKLFTLDHRIIVSKIGELSKTDRKSFLREFSKLFDVLD